MHYTLHTFSKRLLVDGTKKYWKLPHSGHVYHENIFKYKDCHKFINIMYYLRNAINFVFVTLSTLHAYLAAILSLHGPFRDLLLELGINITCNQMKKFTNKSGIPLFLS